MADNLIDKLKELGLNTYEAKVYLALLKQHPATGYEISKESGVPQARAYDTLKALEANNVVVAMGGKPVTYTPVSPEVLLERWERSFKGSINFLREALPSLTNETVEPVMNLRGEEHIYKHAREMISSARSSILLELWREDALHLAADLEEARARGVDIKVVGYDGCELNGIEVYPHRFSRSIEQSLGGHWLVMSVDGLEGMVGTVSLSDRPTQAVVTRNTGIVLIIKELIIHNIFLLEVERLMQPAMEQVFGKDLIMLRQKILGDELHMGVRIH